jgi:hypothetical protein
MLRKARMQGARFRPLLDCRSSYLKINSIAKAINQQSHLLTFKNINLISTETCSRPVFKNQQHIQSNQPTKLFLT